jgi:hypothetical protein
MSDGHAGGDVHLAQDDVKPPARILDLRVLERMNDDGGSVAIDRDVIGQQAPERVEHLIRRSAGRAAGP